MKKADRDKEKWHYRGRGARGEGKPRVAPDGRLSHESRQAFYEGWDKEDQLRAPKPTPEQAAEFNGFFAGLAARVREETGLPPKP